MQAGENEATRKGTGLYTIERYNRDEGRIKRRTQKMEKQISSKQKTEIRKGGVNMRRISATGELEETGSGSFHYL